MKTLYVSDLDGTLLRGDARISQRSLEILTDLTGRGMGFTYATARSIVSAAPAVREFTPSLPVIVHNGVFLVDAVTKKPLRVSFFSDMMIAKAKSILTENEIYPIVYTHDSLGEHTAWLRDRANAGIAAYVAGRKGDPRLREVHSADDLFSGSIHYITCIGTEAEMSPLRDAFSRDAAFKCYYGKDIYADEIWCELTAADATKASAVLRVKETYGFDRVVAFGDAQNDLPLFAVADECYAVENACAELKAAATGIIPSNEEDGVANWLLENA